jgi:serine/threonine-protein kinase
MRHAFAAVADGGVSVVMQSIELRAGRKVHVALRNLGTAVPPLQLKPRGVDWAVGSEGRYKVRGEIARGGVGCVLLAHDGDIGRDVAVKVLHEEHADDAALLQRFVEEAQIGGQLQHPGIVPVYELGLDLRQRPYFTMKLVQGETLATLLDASWQRRQQQAAQPAAADEVSRLLSVFARVCETMAYAHARGVVHRDLKPGNVMVGEFGEVMVMDWGFAKVLGRGDTAAGSARVAIPNDHSVSVAGTILGTPAYMPPEQARGEIERLDARADVFALGAILCQILTGRPPYIGDEVLVQARAGLLEPAYARLTQSGADPSLGAVAMQCLQADAAARFASAKELSEALVQHFAGVDARAEAARIEAAAAQTRAVEERKRRRLAVALGLTGLGFVGVALVLYLGQRARVEHTTREANAALATAWQKVAAGDLAAAVVAVEQARTALRAGTAEANMSATVAEAEGRVSRLKRDYDIEKRLLEVLLRPAGGEWGGRFRTADVYEAMLDLGIDLRQSAPALAAAVRALDTSAEPVILRVLHELALRPESTRIEPLAVPPLLGAADLLDADRERAHIRALWAAHDVSALRALRAGNDVEATSVATLEVLGMALLACGAPTEAISTLGEALGHAPEDFWLNQRLAVLYMPDPARHEDSHLCREIAAAVHPLKRFGIEPRPMGPGRPPRGGRRGVGR